MVDAMSDLVRTPAGRDIVRDVPIHGPPAAELQPGGLQPADRPRPAGRRTVLRLPLLAAALATGPEPAEPEAEPTLRLAGGLPGGVYQSWATQFAVQYRLARPGARVEVFSTAGSGVNLGRVRQGTVTLGLAALDLCAEAAAESSDAARSDVRTDALAQPVALVRVYDDYGHLLVRADSPVSQTEQLSGRLLAVGARGSGTALIAYRLLGATGLDDVRRVELGLADGLDALAAGQVDAMFWSGGIPTVAVARRWRQHPLRLVPLDTAGDALRAAYDGVYRLATVPANTYGNPDPVPTFAVANLLMARPSLPGRRVHDTLEVILTGQAAIAAAAPAFNTFDSWVAPRTQPVPLLPSAARYYRSLKP